MFRSLTTLLPNLVPVVGCAVGCVNVFCLSVFRYVTVEFWYILGLTYFQWISSGEYLEFVFWFHHLNSTSSFSSSKNWLKIEFTFYFTTFMYLCLCLSHRQDFVLIDVDDDTLLQFVLYIYSLDSSACSQLDSLLLSTKCVLCSFHDLIKISLLGTIINQFWWVLVNSCCLERPYYNQISLQNYSMGAETYLLCWYMSIWLRFIVAQTIGHIGMSDLNAKI